MLPFAHAPVKDTPRRARCLPSVGILDTRFAAGRELIWAEGEATFDRLGDGMERSADTAVMLIDEVAQPLKITPKQIRRLERRGAFPIPRLPKLDRHPRYARRLV